ISPLAQRLLDFIANVMREHDSGLWLLLKQLLFIDDWNPRSWHIAADLQRSGFLCHIVDQIHIKSTIINHGAGAARRSDADDAALGLQPMHSADEIAAGLENILAEFL